MARTAISTRASSPFKGQDGRTLLSGTRNPLVTDGRVGDWWINTLGKRLWGPKTSNGWPDKGLINGEKGWSAVEAVVADGNRRVKQVIDWTGGEGDKPPTGGYVGAAGYVSEIALAADIRGPEGPPMLIDGLAAAGGISTYLTQVSVADPGGDNKKQTLQRLLGTSSQLGIGSVAAAREMSFEAAIRSVRVTSADEVDGGDGHERVRVDAEPTTGPKHRSLDRYRSDGTPDPANGGWWALRPSSVRRRASRSTAVAGTDEIDIMTAKSTADVIKHHLGGWASVNQYDPPQYDPGTGAGADAASAFQAAHDALPATGGDIYANGVFLLIAQVNITKPNVRIILNGEIFTTAPTGTLFNVTGTFFKWASPKITSTVTRTSGFFICIYRAPFFCITNPSFRKHYIALELDGSSIGWVIGGEMRTATPVKVAAGGGHIRVGRTELAVAVVIKDVTADSDEVPLDPVTGKVANVNDMCAFGIWLGAVDAPVISGVDIIRSGKDLCIMPYAGHVAANGYVSDSWFDTAEYGLIAATDNGGTIARFRFTKVWTSNHLQHGRYFSGSVNAVIGLHFLECMSSINNYNGTLMDHNVTGLRMIKESSAGNGGAAFSCATGSHNFKIKFSDLGPHDDFGPNGYPIYIPAGCYDYEITDNDCRGNASPMFDGSRASDAVVARNQGYATRNRGYAEVPSGATSLVVTHGLAAAPETTSIIVTMMGPLSGRTIWVDPSSINSTTFTLRLDGTALGYSVGLAWQASMESTLM